MHSYPVWQKLAKNLIWLRENHFSEVKFLVGVGFEPTTLQSLGNLRLFQYSLENNWIDPKLIDYHNVILLKKTRKTLYETPDAYNLEKNSKIFKNLFENFSKFFKVLKLSEMDFALWKTTRNGFLLTSLFFHLSSIGVETKFWIFFENFPSKFRSWNGLKWILRYERALKNDFLLTSLFSPK